MSANELCRLIVKRTLGPLEPLIALYAHAPFYPGEFPLIFKETQKIGLTCFQLAEATGKVEFVYAIWNHVT